MDHVPDQPDIKAASPLCPPSALATEGLVQWSIRIDLHSKEVQQTIDWSDCHCFSSATRQAQIETLLCQRSEPHRTPVWAGTCVGVRFEAGVFGGGRGAGHHLIPRLSPPGASASALHSMLFSPLCSVQAWLNRFSVAVLRGRLESHRLAAFLPPVKLMGLMGLTAQFGLTTEAEDAF